MTRFALLIGFIVALFIALTATVSSQTPERAVIAGTLTEDRNGNGQLDAEDGGAVTMVQIMGRDAQGGYVCSQLVFSDDEGRFQFDALPLREYEIWVWWSPGFLDHEGGMVTLTIPASDLQDGIETIFLRLAEKPEGLIPYPVATGSQTTIPVLCEGSDAPIASDNVCYPYFSARSAGEGQTVSLGNVSFRLPDQGTYAVFVSPPGATNPTVTVCYFEDGGGKLTLNATDGSLIDQEAPHSYSSAWAVFYYITQTVEVGDEAGDPPPARAGGVITPPDTGSAGLR